MTSSDWHSKLDKPIKNESSSVISRTARFSRNPALESLLKELNANLWRAEKSYLDQLMPASHPIILVMGPLRSGTTLFMQWLANTGLVAYPTNLLSRFYQAPIIGSKIQLLLTDPRYNFRNELGEFIQRSDYCSENGKTQGVLAPNEFWYFWRRFLPDPSRDVWSDQELSRRMDTQTLLSELAGVVSVFDKPFAAKGMLFNYNIPFLNSLFEKVVFVQIKRDPVANVASVLDARRRQLGDVNAWYSFMVPEYEDLRDLDPVAQVVGQVQSINRAVTCGLEKVSHGRKLIVAYEDFCANPKKVYKELLCKLNLCDMQYPYTGPQKFNVTRVDDISDRKEIENALSRGAITS